ncbi:PilZ domain-containing protein [Halobacteriovorax vibrionivorans]|uniref:PilZ domain-containing protein n=2 Tax=Halobacteriovoraceae TaxID=1652132 RepID=A0ABY0INV6_9BACT|nr:PilZ domain-containing protein [Halobacteriovorax vibrionivorans]TGD45938.1 PilZ domain-containing protein [Halobacteriovorax sp. Y22]
MVDMDKNKFEQDIIESINEDNEVIIWDVIENNILRLPVKFKSLNSFASKLFLTIEDGLKDSLAHFLRGPGLLKFYIPELQLAFVSELNAVHGTSLEVSYPVKEKRLERREHKRFEPLTPHYAKFQNLKYEIYDISKGGLSIVLGSSQYEQLFQLKNDTLNFTIEFAKESVHVKGKVVDTKKIKPYQISRFPYGAYRLAVQVEDNSGYKKEVKKLQDGCDKLLKDLL